MPSVPGMEAPRSRPLGRRLFAGLLVVGLSGLAWADVARQETKEALPHTLLPWVLLAEQRADRAERAPLVPPSSPAEETP